MKIVCISDTHQKLDQVTVPDGDILLHAGDLSWVGSLEEIAKELKALGEKAKKFKACVFIAGNHDRMAQQNPELIESIAKDNGLIYLQDSLVVVEGQKIYGSPWTPAFGRGWAFQLGTVQQSEEIWAKIPEGVDIVVTHGPPHGLLDGVERDSVDRDPISWEITKRYTHTEHVGCPFLLDRLLKIKPRLWVGGHIHEGYGATVFESVLFVNPSTCDAHYDPCNKPLVVDINDGVAELVS